MHRAKLTSKGQITIPIEVRDAMGLKTGEKVVFLPDEEGAFRIRRVKSILELAGSVPYSGPPITDEEMNRAIGEYVVDMDKATKSGAGKQARDETAA